MNGPKCVPSYSISVLTLQKKNYFITSGKLFSQYSFLKPYENVNHRNILLRILCTTCTLSASKIIWVKDWVTSLWHPWEVVEL